MKKVLGLAGMMLMLCVMMTVGGCKKTGADQGVDLFCEVFDTMTSEINKCNSLNDVNRLNFDNLADKVDTSIPEESLKAPLTDAQKNRIKKATDRFLDALVKKSSELSGGLVSESEMETAISPMRQEAARIIDSSNNLEELSNQFSTM